MISITAPPLRILVHHNRPGVVIDTIRARAPDVTVAVCTDYAGLAEALGRFAPEILFTVRFAGTPAFPRAAIGSSSSLRWIAVGGAGVDHLPPWNPQKVAVTNAAGVGAAVMAEFVMACLYAFAMELPTFGRQQAARLWRQQNLRPIAGRTLVVVGLGYVGSAIASLARRNGMRILGIRAHTGRPGDVDEIGTVEALPAFAARADYMAIALPLTDGTRGLFDRKVLAALPRHAVLINVARGGIVDEQALAEALAADRLRGAALDVFAEEPLPLASPLWSVPNALLTPHNAIVFEDWHRLAAEHFCDNLDRWRRGSPLLNVVAGGSAVPAPP